MFAQSKQRLCLVLFLCSSLFANTSASVAQDAGVKPEGQLKPPGNEPQVEEVAKKGFLEHLQEYYEDAKEAGKTTADSAGHWLAEQYEYATDSASKATNSTTEWITKQYDHAFEAGETTATSAKDWVVDDLGRIGTWQYKVVVLPSASLLLEKEMNKLGNQRWECFSVRSVNAVKVTAYFKRPHRSYLKQLPAKDLLKMVPLLQGGEADTAE